MFCQVTRCLSIILYIWLVQCLAGESPPSDSFPELLSLLRSPTYPLLPGCPVEVSYRGSMPQLSIHAETYSQPFLLWCFLLILKRLQHFVPVSSKNTVLPWCSPALDSRFLWQIKLTPLTPFRYLLLPWVLCHYPDQTLTLLGFSNVVDLNWMGRGTMKKKRKAKGEEIVREEGIRERYLEKEISGKGRHLYLHLTK